MRFVQEGPGSARLPKLPRRTARMDPARRERALGLLRDVFASAMGGAGDSEICDRLVRRGYDPGEVLDLLDDLRAEGLVTLEGGLWRPRHQPPA